ncbi:SRPBCC family protein [Aquamicrobium terrae]|uniref:Carbon monoxide dehydrogenase subunit G n=1 Tax=Aquamicrobium terrae TaxID=1324945 RepID=A0ABV2N7N9_9HYPH
MEIRQKFTVEQDIATVWTALSDIRLVASCVPGAEIVSVSDDQSEIEGLMRTRIGPISAAFGGRGKVVRDEAGYKGSVEGAGADKNSGSRVQIKLDYGLEPTDGGKSTTTSIVAGVVLSGPLAQFGKGALINEIAAQITQQFTANLRQRFAAVAAAKTQDPQAPVAAMPPPASAGELRPLQILLAVLKARFLRLFGSTAA